jgi:hypothetical protein
MTRRVNKDVHVVLCMTKFIGGPKNSSNSNRYYYHLPLVGITIPLSEWEYNAAKKRRIGHLLKKLGISRPDLDELTSYYGRVKCRGINCDGSRCNRFIQSPSDWRWIVDAFRVGNVFCKKHSIRSIQ